MFLLAFVSVTIMMVLVVATVGVTVGGCVRHVTVGTCCLAFGLGPVHVVSGVTTFERTGDPICNEVTYSLSIRQEQGAEMSRGFQFVQLLYGVVLIFVVLVVVKIAWIIRVSPASTSASSSAPASSTRRGAGMLDAC